MYLSCSGRLKTNSALSGSIDGGISLVLTCTRYILNNLGERQSAVINVNERFEPNFSCLWTVNHPFLSEAIYEKKLLLLMPMNDSGHNFSYSSSIFIVN